MFGLHTKNLLAQAARLEVNGDPLSNVPNLADWLSAIGTVSASVIALGLAFLGLWRERQTRLSHEAEARRSMANIYCWAAHDKSVKGGSFVFVKNDTDFPVHGLVYHTETDRVLGWTGLRRAQAGTLSVPPRAVVTEELKFGVPAESVYVSMAFTDATGYAWTRHWNGELSPGLTEPGDRRKPLHLTEGRAAE